MEVRIERAGEALAREIAAFPFECVLADRRSTYEQADLELPAALANEFRCGAQVLASESLAGAQRFAGGAGRHGSFDPPASGGAR